MNHYDCEEVSNGERRDQFNFMTEREKFLNVLTALKKTSDEMSAGVEKLHRLQQEVKFRQADLLALEVKLSSMAVKYGLQPIYPKQKKP